MNQDLPTQLLVAVARAAELLQRVAAEAGRSDEERLELNTATLDLISAIDPETVQSMLEPSVPIALLTWRQIDPEGWSAKVNEMSDEQRERLMDLFAEYGDDPPEGR